jgi:hypothetical protein
VFSNLIPEEWKWIKGYEGLYQISNYGRLKSFHRNPNGTILSTKNSKGDYLTVILRSKRREKERHTRLHVLVAEAFIGDIPDGYEVHHIDGNKQNNIVTNLSVMESHEHRLLTIIEHPEQTKGMNEYNKYTKPKRIQQYTKDGHFIAEYANGEIASRFTNVCQRNILQVANKEEYKPGKTRKQAGGYVWKFADEREVM